MGELKLSNGKEISLDLGKVTVNEWRGFFDGGQKHEEDDKFISNVSGIPISEVGTLLRDDYRRLIQAIIDKGREPLSDPN